jgi:hypothetical protein
MPTAPRSSPAVRPWWRSRWWMPAFCLALGGLVLAAFWIGGNAGDGLRAFALFVVVAGVFLLGGRSDTLSGLGGPGRDERWAMIDLRATAAAGLVVILVLTGCWLYALADGEDGSPYGQIMAAGGVAYLVAVAVLRARS